MNSIEAREILKGDLELNEDTMIAYESAINNVKGYETTINDFYNETKASIEMGQSLVVLGELARQFYNATHRLIGDVIVDLPGSELCNDLGKVASNVIRQISSINQMTEEYATSQISCHNTIDVSYM